ncbi:MAG: mannose-1-phosphate guanylyltransferase [Verrucomicrobiae bacterium]|nr:mannose-1-phosphate guanylyltransferase [Verrucomicrobiae bacterium]
MNWAVIMAGGSGERFWPLSRRAQPKQLQAIVGRSTMIQETVARLRPLVPKSRMVVVTNTVQVREVRRQLPDIGSVLAEPVGRNTAPCVAWAATWISRRDANAVMAVVPADSWIGDVARYRRVVREALQLAAREPVLITVGIAPQSPHTGYGYIEVGAPLRGRFYRAARFVEKPDRATAEEYVASGRYRWNAGMFVWSAKTILAAFERHQPQMLAAIQRIRDGRSLRRIYPKLEKISVDYAIMEKADNVVVATGDFPWDDVGDWAAVARHWPRDDAGNATRGEVVTVEAQDCVLMSQPGHVVAALGVSGLVVVHTKDATLVCRKEDSQRVREVVQRLASDRRKIRYV